MLSSLFSSEANIQYDSIVVDEGGSESRAHKLNTKGKTPAPVLPFWTKHTKRHTNIYPLRLGVTGRLWEGGCASWLKTLLEVSRWFGEVLALVY